MHCSSQSWHLPHACCFAGTKYLSRQFDSLRSQRRMDLCPLTVLCSTSTYLGRPYLQQTSRASIFVNFLVLLGCRLIADALQSAYTNVFCLLQLHADVLHQHAFSYLKIQSADACNTRLNQMQHSNLRSSCSVGCLPFVLVKALPSHGRHSPTTRRVQAHLQPSNPHNAEAVRLHLINSPYAAHQRPVSSSTAYSSLQTGAAAKHQSVGPFTLACSLHRSPFRHL